jgi:glutaredoxin
MTVTVFSTTHCGICHALMQWLDSKDIVYKNVVVDESDEAMDEYMKVNDGMIGTPFSVIERGGETYKIVGYDQPKFISALGL